MGIDNVLKIPWGKLEPAWNASADKRNAEWSKIQKGKQTTIGDDYPFTRYEYFERDNNLVMTAPDYKKYPSGNIYTLTFNSEHDLTMYVLKYT